MRAAMELNRELGPAGQQPLHQCRMQLPRYSGPSRRRTTGVPLDPQL